MSTKDPDGPELMSCPCCGLRQPRAYDATGVTARVCAKCTHHQGEQDARRLRRAEVHEALLRERLDACRGSEAKAREDAAKALRDAADARRATAAALRSRDQLAARIAEAAEGSDPQALQWLARSRDVVQWAERARQDDERRDPF